MTSYAQRKSCEPSSLLFLVVDRNVEGMVHTMQTSIATNGVMLSRCLMWWASGLSSQENHS
jgi:hypothetical protein